MNQKSQPLEIIKALLKQTIGVREEDLTPDILNRCIEGRMHLCHAESIEQYISLLQQSKEEFQAVIENLVVPETWFFRDQDLYPILVDYIKNSAQQCRILSLPCSSGEEPYSIAIAFAMAGIPESLYKIDAIDISKHALDKARKGVFLVNSFRGSNLEYRPLFFDCDPQTSAYVLKEGIRDQVSFRQGNIFDGACQASLKPYDVILCRNLLIYLNPTAQLELLQILDKKLAPRGILIVSPAEAQIAKRAGFISKYTTKLYILCKPEPSEVMEKSSQKKTAPGEVWGEAKYSLLKDNTSLDSRGKRGFSQENQADLPSAAQLLARISDKEYVDEWTLLIQKEKLTEDNVSEHSVIIFRLDEEWFAISTLVCAEVAHSRKIHHLPHRSGPVFLGVINLQGQLRLCLSLAHLLQIEEQMKQNEEVKIQKYHRMIAIRKEHNFWVFPVDEVYGIFRCDISQLQNVPITVSKSKANYFKGVFSWEGKNVGYLDEDLLFSGFQRMTL